MLADSFKFNGNTCFKNHWAGFDTIKPINIIIGRNNTGKSHLLEFARVLCRQPISAEGWKWRCNGVLEEGDLRRVFAENSSGGDLVGDHWNHNGKLFVGVTTEWEVDLNGNAVRVSFSENAPTTRDESRQKARERRIGTICKQVNSRISGKIFRHLSADRDVRPEALSKELSLAENGAGATNIIRRYLTSATFPRELVEQSLRKALNDIYRVDGNFDEIVVKLHDDRDGNIWEVFLAEAEKGLIALSRSGSGFKTVLLVLLNLLVIPEYEKNDKSNYVFAFEELENNLHPALLRRLLQYIESYAIEQKATIFLTTHSSVTLDLFGSADHAQIIHVRHDGVSANAERISAHFDRCGVLSELGARPSDLLQANGVLWLEGPSDRIYLNRFIEIFSDGKLREGKDYQCAFYGGSVLASSQFTTPEEEDSELTNLLRLNSNVALVCDGDRTAATGDGSELKERVKRVESEMAKIPRSKLWITQAKEIENYIPGEVWGSVYEKKNVRDPNEFDRFPSKNLSDSTFVKEVLGRASFDKVEFAMEAAPLLTKSMLASRFELQSEMNLLVETIEGWNK